MSIPSSILLERASRIRLFGRVVATAAVSGVILMSTGCSLLFVSPPPDPPPRPPRTLACTTSRLAPVADTVLTGAEVVRTVYAIGASNGDYGDFPISREVDIALGVSFTALFLISAGYGFANASECERAQAAWEKESQLRERRIQMGPDPSQLQRHHEPAAAPPRQPGPPLAPSQPPTTPAPPATGSAPAPAPSQSPNTETIDPWLEPPTTPPQP